MLQALEKTLHVRRSLILSLFHDGGDGPCYFCLFGGIAVFCGDLLRLLRREVETTAIETETFRFCRGCALGSEELFVGLATVLLG